MNLELFWNPLAEWSMFNAESLLFKSSSSWCRAYLLALICWLTLQINIDNKALKIVCIWFVLIRIFYRVQSIRKPILSVPDLVWFLIKSSLHIILDPINSHSPFSVVNTIGCHPQWILCLFQSMLKLFSMFIKVN